MQLCVDLKLHEPGSKNRKIASTPPLSLADCHGRCSPEVAPGMPGISCILSGLLIVVVAKAAPNLATGAELGKWRAVGPLHVCRSRREGTAEQAAAAVSSPRRTDHASRTRLTIKNSLSK